MNWWCYLIVSLWCGILWLLRFSHFLWERMCKRSCRWELWFFCGCDVKYCVSSRSFVQQFCASCCTWQATLSMLHYWYLQIHCGCYCKLVQHLVKEGQETISKLYIFLLSTRLAWLPSSFFSLSDTSPQHFIKTWSLWLKKKGNFFQEKVLFLPIYVYQPSYMNTLATLLKIAPPLGCDIIQQQ